MDAMQPSDVAPRRNYTGTSHAWLVLTAPTIGYLASVLFVLVGPFAWWVNWLVAGAVWGFTRPARNVFRSALKYITYEFRSPEFSWWTCVKDTAKTEWWDWRREPGRMTVAYFSFTVTEAVLWPFGVPMGALLFGQLDHG